MFRADPNPVENCLVRFDSDEHRAGIDASIT